MFYDILIKFFATVAAILSLVIGIAEIVGLIMLIQYLIRGLY